MKPHTKVAVQALLRAGFAALGALKVWFEIESGRVAAPQEAKQDEKERASDPAA